jgi:putative hydrolase of the HAD superfamily
MVRAILFDLGDTLLDFRPMSTKVVVALGAKQSYERLEQEGVKLPTLEKYRRGNVAAVNWALIWSRLRGREFSVLELMRRRTALLGAPDNDAFMLEVGWLWYQPVVEYSSVAPDLIETLGLFRDAGIKMGIVSNTMIGAPLLDRHMAEKGLLEFFPVRIYSSDVGYRKPNPIIFRRALAAIGEEPKDILFVGDVVRNDVIGAGRMGMKTALRQRNSTATSHPLADYCVRQISELKSVVLSNRTVEAAPKRGATVPVELMDTITDNEEFANQTS